MQDRVAPAGLSLAFVKLCGKRHAEAVREISFGERKKILKPFARLNWGYSTYSLEDAYKYLRAKYSPEVAFLCLVKVFGEQKVAIGKLFYKPKRKDNRNKQPGHVPDDSTYIKNFDKMSDNATSLFLLRFRD